MNDGDGKDGVNFSNEKENQQPKRKNKSGADEFAQAIARIAVAQVCESGGFQTFQQSALDTLADVGVRYIREIGRIASSHANLANRSQCNVFDVIQGLEDLGSVEGFLGVSDVSHSLSGSGVVRDLIRYVGKAEEIPFAYLLPGFPVVKERKLNPSFAQAGFNSPDEHIPSWLPKFPDPENFGNFDSGNLKSSDNKIDTLLELQPKLTCNGSEEGVAVEVGDVTNTKAQRAPESNPFLARPLQFGEKDVSLPLIPAKLLDEAVENRVSALEPVLPAKEAASGGLCEEPEDPRNILLSGRPNVNFKLGNGKKSLGKESVEKICLWFGDDCDGKDEKKAEQILSENSEEPQEVSHL